MILIKASNNRYLPFIQEIHKRSIAEPPTSSVISDRIDLPGAPFNARFTALLTYFCAVLSSLKFSSSSSSSTNSILSAKYDTLSLTSSKRWIPTTSGDTTILCFFFGRLLCLTFSIVISPVEISCKLQHLKGRPPYQSSSEFTEEQKLYLGFGWHGVLPCLVSILIQTLKKKFQILKKDDITCEVHTKADRFSEDGGAAQARVPQWTPGWVLWTAGEILNNAADPVA